jgi:prepilin-type N-terminal cleavage/methylation domain-containing protein
MKKGFTLIELLVVIGIMALLTALAAFNFNQARARSRDIQRKSDMKNLQSALEAYRNDYGFYPNSANITLLNNHLISMSSANPYIKSAFMDPKIQQNTGSWVNYMYTYGTQTTYTLQACLENRSDQAATGGSCGPGNTGKYFVVTQP